MIQLKYNPPAGFLDSQTLSGYTVSSEMKQVWAVELDLLQELMRVCNKYNLRIWADGGTLIGAMRHQGFIPWDDDIDLAMPRKDYDRLCEVAATEFRHPYFFQNIATDPHYTHRHAQLRNSLTAVWSANAQRPSERFNQGIFIDIFIIDGMPYDPRALAKHVRRIRQAQLRLKIARKIAGRLPEPLYRFCRNHTHCLSDSYQFSRLESLLRSVDADTTPLLCIMSLRLSHRFQDARCYQSTRLVPFEYVQIPVMEAYDEVLTTHYGDWRTPAKAPSVHGSQHFDVSRSYLDI
ncbi:MAG: LicD family protein [Bacteroidales bacterium]|nr:LicD family protein [Candidatus Liminaster caballi]